MARLRAWKLVAAVAAQAGQVYLAARFRARLGLPEP